MKRKQSLGKKLICFDFDETLIKGNIVDVEDFFTGEATKEELDLFLQDPETGWRDQEKIIRLFSEVLGLGHHIAITSFSPCINFVTYAIGTLGFKEEQVKVISYRPQKSYMGKGGHVQKAMKWFNIECFSQVCLVDDSMQNVETIKKQKIAGILVKKDNDSHYDLIRRFLSGEDLLAELDPLRMLLSEDSHDSVLTFESSVAQVGDIDQKDCDA